MLKFVGVACGLIALSAVIGYTNAGKENDSVKIQLMPHLIRIKEENHILEIHYDCFLWLDTMNLQRAAMVSMSVIA